MEKFDEWFTSLTVKQKEEIIRKAVKKFMPKLFKAEAVDAWRYPECSIVWNKYLSGIEKEWVYKHCTDDHGIITPEWSEGWMMSE